MQILDLTTALADREDFSLSGVTYMDFLPGGDGLWLLAGSAATNAISRFQVNEGEALSEAGVFWPSFGNGFSPDDGMCVTLGDETRLLSRDSFDGTIALQPLDTFAIPSSPLQLLDQGGAPVLLSDVICLEINSTTYLAGTGPAGSGVALYSVAPDWRVSLQSQIPDTAKTAASGISDLLEMTVGASQFLVSASQQESGLTSYHVAADGSLVFADSIAAADGLWISGLARIVHAQADGQEFVIGISPDSSTLSAVRLNPMGVFFVSDIVTDTLNTRFQNAIALDRFSVDGRDFIITGGSDSGLSLFELLPGGTLFHHQSLEQTGAWNLGPIRTIATTVFASEIQIFATGSTAGGMAQFTLPSNTFGQRLTGTGDAERIEGGALDDLVMGLSGDDELIGGTGDDTLIAGEGHDTLTGGEGADVFVFQADGQADTIADFQIGTDRIHLDDWGMVYDPASLEFTATAQGATIAWRGEMLFVESADGNPIQTDHWGADDFIF